MLRKSPRRRANRLEQLEPRQMLAGDAFLVNFQHDEASTPPHYLRDTGQLFGARGDGFTYGWTSDHTDQSRERSVVADQRLDTLVHIEAGQAWEIALPNGDYEVTVVVGDPGNNDGVHTINVEGVNYWNATPDGDDPLTQTHTVTVTDGRLTIDADGAADKATRIDYAHIIGVSSGGNLAPAAPTITEPSVIGQVVNPADVHMEAIGFADPEGDAHKSSDWQIWTTGAGAEMVWQTLAIQGVERLHTHLGDGVFQGALAGANELDPNTDYELRVRFRDDAGSVSNFATREFQTGATSVVFAMQIEDIDNGADPVWETLLGAPVELPIGVQGILAPGDPILAFDFDASTDSDSPGNEQAFNLLDGDPGTKYLNFGETDTGFIVTPTAPSVVRSFKLTTANDSEERDPASWVLYGTNDAITTSAHGNGRGENWSPISSGFLSLPSARETDGPVVSFSNNTAFSSYKLVFPTVKNEGFANSMQLADVAFYTTTTGTGSSVLSPGDFIVPIQDIAAGPESDSSAGEGPTQAIDGSTATKYINHGKENSGLIVTPTSGASVVSSFQIWTANDAAERDPTAWELYGTNEPIQSTNHGFGQSENWTLIDTGSISLPFARFAAGGLVSVDNTAGSFTSYRIVFTGLRDAPATDSVQFSEIQFYGESTGSEVPPTLRLESGVAEGLIEVSGDVGPGNQITHFPTIGSHAAVKVVVSAGSSSLELSESDFSFQTDDGQDLTVYLPAVNLAAGGELVLWVSSSGSTYYGLAGQTTPDFTSLAREANLDIPYIATQPGFVIEEVGADYRLPVNIAFVPDPGPDPDDPLYFVTELYGSIQVVTRDGTRHEFATGLLDYNPTGPISGSGEQGLTGIAVQRDATDPDVYHLYVGMLADNGSPPGGAVHYPKVERLTSVAGGLSMSDRTVLLNMQPETQGQSHQISNVSIGPDGMLYVHNGDGFDASTALDLDQFRGKVLRMNLDGSAPTDNPFYNAGDGVTARDYVYAYGLRNPFGGAWRASDGEHYEVENGPSVDRFAKVTRGGNYGWNGSNASMEIGAIYNWAPSTAPVNIAFVQPETFRGSLFPADMQDHAFVSESGPTYATGPQANGKRLTEFTLDASGALVDGPVSLVEYVGTGKSTIVGLAAGPDGLYFTQLYEDSGANGPTATGARIYRVRYVNPLAGDYDIDGDVDEDDLDVWRETYGSNLLLGADGNRDGRVDAADYTVWRDAFSAAQAAAAAEAIAAEPVQTEASTGDEPLAAPTVASESPLELAYAGLDEPVSVGRGARSAYMPPVRVDAAARDLSLLLLDTGAAMASAEQQPAAGGSSSSQAEESGEESHDALSVRWSAFA